MNIWNRYFNVIFIQTNKYFLYLIKYHLMLRGIHRYLENNFFDNYREDCSLLLNQFVWPQVLWRSLLLTAAYTWIYFHKCMEYVCRVPHLISNLIAKTSAANQKFVSSLLSKHKVCQTIEARGLDVQHTFKRMHKNSIIIIMHLYFNAKEIAQVSALV